MTSIDKERIDNIKSLSSDKDLQSLSKKWIVDSAKHRYSYNFTWMGRPIIQYPQDMIAMQELIWQVKPDLVIETGIAHGGSLIYYASLLELLSLSGESEGRVLGIDIDIREHNRLAIESHPMSKRIDTIQGSSISRDTINQVKDAVKDKRKVLVVLDSNHTHDHVLSELEAYAPLVSVGSYCVVFDTIVEDMPNDFFPDRPWGKGDNPKTAVWKYLQKHPEFEIDKTIDYKLLISVAPDGFLRRAS